MLIIFLKAGDVLLLSEKVDLRQRNINRATEGQFMIKGLIQVQDTHTTF